MKLRVGPLRPFFELLPYRIEQTLGGRGLRRFRVAEQRGAAVCPATPAAPGRRRLYVDLAVISRHDAGTGIQRVVRALAIALIEDAPREWDIRFVAADRRGPYHGIAWPDPGMIVDAAQIDGRPGDVFLGLDFALDTVRFHRSQLERFRRSGGALWFLVCDLLPAERPGWFSPNNVVRYKAWLDILAGIADGFLCISQQTQDDLARVLDDRYSLTRGYRSHVVPMGYSIRESMLQAALVGEGPPVRFDTAHPFSLMVGTLEPRKGHADVLAAFSELWRSGSDERLVLVGRLGWKVEGLRDAIRSHPEHGGKLLWFDDVEDLELELIYQACQGVIIGSHAEGFGLPLIEALGHGKPVLARDLPIFRIHKHAGVRYFPVHGEAHAVADSVREWAGDIRAGRITVTAPEKDWKASAQAVLAAIG